MYSSKVKRLWLHRSTLRELSLKQLKAKYSGSILGLWWAVLLPLLLALCIDFIFTQVYKVQIKNFALFLLSGIIPWIFFSNAVTEATVSFAVHAAELRQGLFPRECVPISSVVSNFLNFAIGFFCLLPLFWIALPRTFLLLPFLFLVLALQLFFVLGLGVLFASWNIFWKDLSHLLSVGMMVWFWITPVFYSPQDIAFPYRWVCLLNPMTPFVVSYQKIIFEGIAPPLSLWGSCLVLCVVCLLGGYAYFIRQEPELLKRL